MELLSEIEEDLVRDTAEKESQNPEIDELRLEVRSLEAHIHELKSRIGEYYWQVFCSTGKYEPSLNALIMQIQKRVDQITATELEIQIIEDGDNQPIQPPVVLQLDRVVCHSCGAVNEGSARICASCGMKLKEDLTSEYKVEDYGICPLCGSALSEDAVFCYTCGARIKI
jgi:ribosomal protein L40E